MQKLLNIAVLSLVLGWASATSAQFTLTDQIIQTVSGGNPLSVGPGTAGFSFTVGSAPLTIASLGVFDEFSDGVLSQSHEVGIWNATSQALVASANVTPTATFANSFFWVNLASPITLAAGTTYRIGAQYADIDLDLARGNVPAGSVTVNSGVTLGDAYLSSGSGFQFPDLNVAAANSGFFGPNAGFSAVPEPSAYALVTGLGLVAFIAYRRFRTHEASTS